MAEPTQRVRRYQIMSGPEYNRANLPRWKLVQTSVDLDTEDGRKALKESYPWASRWIECHA